jgi:hypothetical protein
LGEDRNVHLGEELLHKKLCVSVRYRDTETTVPAACRAASSELHRGTSAKLARTNGQQYSVQAVRFQRIPETFFGNAA